MLNIDELRTSALVIVLEKDNWERMEKHDPITLETFKSGGALPPAKYPDNMQMLIAYEDNADELHKIIREGGMGALLTHLRRGYQFVEGLDGTHMAYSLNHSPKES